jgi:heme-degrading monooxygenase HmoA
MIVDLVTFRVRNGKEQEFEALHQENLRLMRRSRGFINQIMLRSLDDPLEYHAEIRWVSKDYLDRFSSQEGGASGPIQQKGSSVLEGPPTHRLLEPV